MRGEIGFYVGPALHHYRCITVYKTETKQQVITDTVKFLPYKIPIPSMSTNDYLAHASDDIIDILNNPPNNLPAIQAGCKTRQAVRDIAIALKQDATIPPPL